jgi:hypothetical protein
MSRCRLGARPDKGRPTRCRCWKVRTSGRHSPRRLDLKLGSAGNRCRDWRASTGQGSRRRRQYPRSSDIPPNHRCPTRLTMQLPAGADRPRTSRSSQEGRTRAVARPRRRHARAGEGAAKGATWRTSEQSRFLPTRGLPKRRVAQKSESRPIGLERGSLESAPCRSWQFRRCLPRARLRKRPPGHIRSRS